MTAGGVGEVSGPCSTLYHMQHIESGHWSIAEPVTFAHVAKERPLFITGNSSRADPGVQVLFKARVTGHFMALSTFFMQSQPPAFTMHKIVADLHPNGGADARETIDHRADECTISEPD